jgi:PadR family transcriptional regulator PadR
MRTSDLRLIILKTFKEEEFYGYDIHKKLISEGITIEAGRIYRVLNQMQKDGWLESRWAKSGKGPEKKLYKLGKKGEAELDRNLMYAVQTIHRAYGEYIRSLPPERSVFKLISRSVVAEIASQSNVVLVAESSSSMYDRLLGAIQDKLVDSKIFVVKPKSVTVKLQLQNITYLEGNLESIPLRNGYIDLLITADMPTSTNMDKATREWHRVVKNKGKLAVISPAVLFRSYEDPLSIGDFIEKWEHQTYKNRKPGEGGTLIGSLRKHFQSLEEKDVVHMKLLIAKKFKKPS